MPTKDTLLSKRFTWPGRCLLLLLVVSVCPGYLTAKVTVQATKDCSTESLYGHGSTIHDCCGTVDHVECYVYGRSN
jgi:hypothetical protein